MERGTFYTGGSMETERAGEILTSNKREIRKWLGRLLCLYLWDCQPPHNLSLQYSESAPHRQTNTYAQVFIHVPGSLQVFTPKEYTYCIYTHTHTHTHIYIYIYAEIWDI